MYMRGMAAELGIVKGQPFAPDAKARALLDKAARTATRMGHVVAYTPSPLLKNQLWYPDRHCINAFPGNATFTSDSFDYIDARTAFFTYAYSTSPGMAVSMDNVGAKYPAAYSDADGDFLQRRSELQAACAQGRPCCPLLVGDGVRPDHRLRSR